MSEQKEWLRHEANTYDGFLSACNDGALHSGFKRCLSMQVMIPHYYR
jgi:hypothetical protein